LAYTLKEDDDNFRNVSSAGSSVETKHFIRN